MGGSRTAEDQELIESAAREVIERSKARVSKLRFGPRQFLADDRLSTKPAPGPKGPPTAQLLEDAKRRRRERAGQERGR